MATRTAFSGALCGEALGFLELFPEGGSKRGLGWRLKIFPFASLGSGTGGGVVALRGCACLFRPHPALACHLPHPGEGCCGGSVRFRDSADFLAGGNFCQKVIFLEVAPTPSLPPGGEGGTPVPDEGETGGRTHVTQPTNTNRQASIPRPGALPCHPERSGTTRQKSRAPTNHCRTANPAPSGAPAGGISIVKRYHIKQRATEKKPSPGWGRWHASAG